MDRGTRTCPASLGPSLRSPQAYAYAKLPRAGLGNMLLVWARAAVFAHLNDMPLLVDGWAKVRIGPILRREVSHRAYGRYFLRTYQLDPFRRSVLRSMPAVQVVEPELERVEAPPATRTAYVFSRIPHWSDYFAGLREHRDFVRTALLEMLRPNHRTLVTSAPAPVVGMHVRMGDYRPLEANEDFAMVGGVRTPTTYFIEMIETIRSLNGSTVPVTVFSDGRPHELSELLALPRVSLAEVHSDISDMLLLSRSQLIVVSAGSTFGYWAAFLSDAFALLHPDHIHAPIRAPDHEGQCLEAGVDPGRVETWPSSLVSAVECLPS